MELFIPSSNTFGGRASKYCNSYDFENYPKDIFELLNVKSFAHRFRKKTSFFIKDPHSY